MKALFILLLLALAAPAAAATEAADANAGNAQEQTKNNAAQTKESAKDAADGEKKPAPGEYSCEYYTVNLPDGWKAIRAPEDRQGIVNAIFANNSGSTIITMIVGPRKGAEPAMIAGMFADQFKAPRQPVEKNGRYIFTFQQNDAATQKPVTATATITADGDNFMLTSYIGSQKEVQNFFKNNLKCKDEYAKLMP